MASPLRPAAPPARLRALLALLTAGCILSPQPDPPGDFDGGIDHGGDGIAGADADADAAADAGADADADADRDDAGWGDAPGDAGPGDEDAIGTDSFDEAGDGSADGEPTSDPDYDGLCDGVPFATTCSGGADCATSDRAARWLELWWQVMIETLDAPEDLVRGTLEVTLADVADGPLYVFFHVRFVVHLDWIRARHVTTVNLGDYPLAADPDDAAVLELLRREIACTHLPRAAIPYAEAVALAASCHPSAAIDVCHLDALDRPLCSLAARAHGIIDEPENRCVVAAIELETGVLETCEEVPCRWE